MGLFVNVENPTARSVLRNNDNAYCAIVHAAGGMRVNCFLISLTADSRSEVRLIGSPISLQGETSGRRNMAATGWEKRHSLPVCIPPSLECPSVRHDGMGITTYMLHHSPYLRCMCVCVSLCVVASAATCHQENQRLHATCTCCAADARPRRPLTIDGRRVASTIKHASGPHSLRKR